MSWLVDGSKVCDDEPVLYVDAETMQQIWGGSMEAGTVFSERVGSPVHGSTCRGVEAWWCKREREGDD